MSNVVLVVGGAGYIGAHTCKALARCGFLPVTFDDLSTGHANFVKWGPLVVGDIQDGDRLDDAFRTHRPNAVIHFAAKAYVGESVIDPRSYYRTNVVGTLALLDAMLRADVKRLVLSSTCAIYGQPDTVPIGEETQPRPINPYGATKLMAERILADYRSAYDLSFITLRYFNACGADPDGEIGELRDPETHLIPRAMMALQGHVHDFAVFGNDFDTPDGTAVRDYIHVSDLAEAHLAAVKAMAGASRGDAYNLGTGKGLSVGEVLDAVAVHTGRALPAVAGRRRPGDPSRLVADPRRARQALAFTPRHSDLNTIVETAWAWHRKVHPARGTVMLKTAAE